MGRFDFVSPGAAVSSTLAKLLAERKVEERQRMLDGLTMNADQRAAADAAETTRVRDSQLESAKQQRELQRVEALTSNMSMGASPDTWAPDDVELAKRYGKFREVSDEGPSSTITSMQGGNGETVEDFKPDTSAASKGKKRLSYVGSTEEQKEERERKELGSVIVGLLQSQDPKKREVGETMAQMTTAMHGKVPKEILDLLMPKRPVNVYSEDTGALSQVGSVSPDAEIIHRSRAPRPLRGQNVFPVGEDEDGNVQIYDPADGSTKTLKGTHKPRSGADPREASLGLPVGALKEYQLRVQAIEPGDKGTIEAAKLAAHGVAQSARVTDAVRNWATVFIENPRHFEQLMRNPQTRPELTEREVTQLQQLTHVLATENLKAIYSGSEE